MTKRGYRGETMLDRTLGTMAKNSEGNYIDGERPEEGY